MTHHQEHQDFYEPVPSTEDEKADAVAALAIIVIAILAAIHFVYTGGLPAFVADFL